MVAMLSTALLLASILLDWPGGVALGFAIMLLLTALTAGLITFTNERRASGSVGASASRALKDAFLHLLWWLP